MEKPFEIVREKMHTEDGVTRHGLDMGKPDEPGIWTYRKSGYDKSMCSKPWLKNGKEKSPRGGWPRDPMTVVPVVPCF